MDQVLKDKRFAHIGTDVRFRSVPRRERKVKIDKRFQSMFTEKRFKVKYTVDKRGRPERDTTDEHLKKYYDLSSSSSSDEENDEADKEDRHRKNKQLKEVTKIVSRKTKSQKSAKKDVASSSESDVVDDDDDDDNSNRKYNFDYARGEGNVESSSSSDEIDSDEEDDNAGMVHPWGELSSGAAEAEQITHRLAICNMDWDRVSAQDLYVLVKSFTPPGGDIKSVKIYLSDFGRERLQEEEVCGPKELTDSKPVDEELKVNDPEGEKYHMEKLRQYQLNRLRYYYAVVECDSKETANKVYEECDGLEYESSASRLDLRFIPNDIGFDEVPHSVASGSADLSSYRPKYFTTTALQHAKVKLTWDETDPDRLQKIRKAFDEVEEKEMDLGAYLATSSEESEDEVEHVNNPEDDDENDSSSDEERESRSISKYRSLLQGIEEEEEGKKKSKDVELEITWGTGLKEKAESIVQSKMAKKDLTPWEKFLETKKEKKKQKREEKKQQLKADTEVETGGDLYSDDELPSDVDLNDPFFAESQLETGPKKNARRKTAEKERNDEQTAENQQETAKKQAELELLLMDEDASKHHFNLKKLLNETQKKKKNKKRKKEAVEDSSVANAEEDFKLNVQDPRFSAIFNSHAYNIDPSEPSFKKTKGMEAIIQEKQKRQQESSVTLQHPKQLSTSEAPRADMSHAELSLLVKSVKSKASNYRRKKK